MASKTCLPSFRGIVQGVSLKESLIVVLALVRILSLPLKKLLLCTNLTPAAFRRICVTSWAVGAIRPSTAASDVLSDGYGFEVRRIHTVNYTTEMINRESSRNWAYEQFIGVAMRNYMTTPLHHHAVAIAGLSACPQPACIGLYDLSPEVNLRLTVHPLRCRASSLAKLTPSLVMQSAHSARGLQASQILAFINDTRRRLHYLSLYMTYAFLDKQVRTPTEVLSGG